MAKKGAKKGKGKTKAVNEEKKKELQKFWDDIEIMFDEYESRMNSRCTEICTKISKMYVDKLKSLPENVRNMTLIEYMEMQSKVKSEQQSVTTDLCGISSQYERSKLNSEKKKTLKKNRIERKRSVSVSVCNGTQQLSSTLLSRTSRVLSESSLNTPLSKRSMVITSVVTPKFNPKVPISKACMRKPRAGEILMSLSGSPLQNMVDDVPEKPGVALSLGGGQVIKITEDTEISKLATDLKKLDEETKQTLASVKLKLDRILQP